MAISIDFPSVFKWLWEQARYKVAHGGRWSWKSTTVAKYIVIRCTQKPIRVLCARETQKSIKESVHHLIASQIKSMGLQDLFVIENAAIKGKNGSYIFFDGLLRNVHNIKSLDDVDICWIEEAQNVSKESWTDLTPTIRKNGSEIIVTFNRKYMDDETDKRFVQNPPENSIVREINYDDVYKSDEIPKILSDEITDCKNRDPSLITFNHIYKNKPIGVGAKIWTAFDYKTHVLTSDHRLYKTLSMENIAKYGDCFMAMDPHSKFYPFCIWLALVPKNEANEEFYKVVFNEWPSFDSMGDYYSELRKKMYYDGSIKDMTTQIYVRDGTAEYGIKILKRFVDTRFAKGAGGENWSTSTVGMVEEFARPENGGMLFNMPAEIIIDKQRSVIIDDMKYNQQIEVTAYNEPDWYVMPHCKNVIQSVENHRCVEGTEKEDEKYKDPSDALRILYAGIQGHKYTRGKKSKSGFHISSGWLG